MIKNNRAAIYVRVSTDEQARDGYSIDAQINTLKMYCKLYNYEVIEIYKDEGLSGKDLNRKSLLRMLDDAQKNNFDLVIVWKVSRLSRNLKDLLLIVDKLNKFNVAFISHSETFNTLTPVGRMTLQILGSIAEFERNTIVENIKLAIKEKANRGEWTGGRVFGYKNINKKLEIEDKEAEIVKYIFNSYLEGMGIKEISESINDKRILTSRRGQFNKSSIYTIIKNAVYCGLLRHSENDQIIYIKGIHNPIISEDIFNKVQQKLKTNCAKTKCEGYFILSGLLKCPYCRSTLVGYHTSKYRYYRCSKYHNYGKDYCRGFLVNADKIEGEIYKRIQNRIRSKYLKTLYDDFEIKEVFDKNYKFSIKNVSYDMRKSLIKYFVSEINLTSNREIDKITYIKN